MTSLKVAVLVAAIALPAGAAYGALGDDDDSSRRRHHASGEPVGAHPAAPPRTIATGTTPSGSSWTAVVYPTRSGTVCLDVTIGAGTGGGCYSRELSTPQWGRSWDAASNESIVSGLHRPGRPVTVRFGGGEPTVVRADAEGYFVVAGSGNSATLTFG